VTFPKPDNNRSLWCYPNVGIDCRREEAYRERFDARNATACVEVETGRLSRHRIREAEYAVCVEPKIPSVTGSVLEDEPGRVTSS
jgi:hypothetical protein